MTLKKRLYYFVCNNIFNNEHTDESNDTSEYWYKKGYEVGYSDGQHNYEYSDSIQSYFDVISYEMLHYQGDDDDYDEDEELALDTFKELDEYMGYALSNDD